MGRHKVPARTSVPIMKQMFDIADQKGVSLASLCDKMDVYPNQITDWRAGRHTPSIFVIMGLADALGLELVLKDR